ncbi:MAG: hypothetical protein R6V06_03445 [Kiritimatiellia bacterium]
MANLRRYFDPVIVRMAVYAGLLALITVAFLHLPTKSFREDSIVEWIQFSFLFLAAGMFLFAGVKNRTHSALSYIIALFFLIACMRECDRFFDRLICDGFWKIPVSVLVTAIITLIFLQTRNVIDSTRTVINWRAFGMLASGFMVLLFSRIFGHNNFWSDLIGPKNQRTVLRVIEEGVEFLAYFIFLAGSVEYAIKTLETEDNSCSHTK